MPEIFIIKPWLAIYQVIPRLLILLFPLILNNIPVYAVNDNQRPDLNGKNILIIIASRNFQDMEFSVPYQLLKKCSASITIASSSRKPAKGMLGKIVTPDKLLKDCIVEKYDAVLFIGGSGASEYFGNKIAQKIARDAVKQGKILGALCIAPVTLANAGVLKGRKATCFPSVADRLVRNGVIIIKQDIVRDGKILTASGPQAANPFAETLLQMLK